MSPRQPPRQTCTRTAAVQQEALCLLARLRARDLAPTDAVAALLTAAAVLVGLLAPAPAERRARAEAAAAAWIDQVMEGAE